MVQMFTIDELYIFYTTLNPNPLKYIIENRPKIVPNQLRTPEKNDAYYAVYRVYRLSNPKTPPPATSVSFC